MEKITPQPANHEAKAALEWLAQKENHGLDESGLTDIVRLLICKVNQLSHEVNQLSHEVDCLRNRVNQHDSFI